jgi:integrase
MRGNITVKVPGRVYELRVSRGRDPVTGRYRQKSVTVRGTRAEAERALRQLIDEVEAGRERGTDDPGLTFGGLLDEWLRFTEGRGRSPTTIERYRTIIERQLKPTLGDMPLARLRTKAFDDLYRDLGQRLAPLTVTKVHLVARAALDRARKWGWIAQNPARDAEPPSPRRSTITTPSREQLAKLLKVADAADPVFAAYLRLGAATGARRGELCALRWSDIDLEAARVVIERGIVLVAGGLVERPTKTHSRRVVALDEGTVRVLGAHREREEAMARACGVELDAPAFVFSRRPGGTLPLRPENATATFAATARAAGVEGLSLKDATRHLAATRLIAAGVDVRTVAGRLGHANASTTLDVYAHWLPERDREAATIIGAELDDASMPE